MKAYKSFLATLVLIALAIFALIPLVNAWESKYKTHATSADVVFAPSLGGYRVMHVYATSDKSASVLEAQTADVKRFPTANATNSATVISIENAAYGFTNDHRVVYVHANGTLLNTSVSSATTTNITLASGLTVAGASGDAVYKLGTAAKWSVGSSSALSLTGGNVYAIPADSPARFVVDGGSNAVVIITTDR